ncbi:MAG: CBS domain-containing protein [Lautropia sp.]
MNVQEIMSRDVLVARPTQSVQQAAEIMAREDIGSLPVGDDDRLVGVITDRDIAIRCIAQGQGPSTPVEAVMSKDVKYCFDDQEVREVAESMGSEQLRRLPVVNRDKRLVGIVALADVARADRERSASTALKGISRP